jgi:outer membrane protein, multidrug efflux system
VQSRRPIASEFVPARPARRTLLCMLAVGLLASGCATQAPPPSEEVRKQALLDISLDRPWQAAQSLGLSGSEPLQDEWLSTFQDPTLDALVREAMTKNADLRVAAARLEQAAEYIVIAESALRPSISLFGTGGSNTGGGGDASSALQAAILSASWELDVWGRWRYARNATQEAYASARADYEFARQSLAASVAKAWFTATQLSMSVEVATDTLGAANQLQSLAEDRQRVGAGTETDTALARASSRGAENVLRQAEFARGQAIRAIEILIGRYPAAELAARAQLPVLSNPVPVGVPLQILERRPDVIAAERRVAAAFNRVGEAKAARLPQLTLSLSVGADDSDILELKEDFDNPVGGLGGRLLAPIYQGGALEAQVRIRTAEQKEAVADYARVALRALSDVENAIAASENLGARAALLTQAFEEQTRALEFTRTRLRVGRADRRALEQQRVMVNDARLALVDVQVEQLAARVNLHLSLGGSFELPQQQAETKR